jgi:uncharacterized membrane protein YccC
VTTDRPPGSGLFPAGPPRPTYREPHPVRARGVLAGLGAGAGWLLLFMLLGNDLPGRVWWTVGAGGAAWLAALALVRYGDRGVAVGVAAVTGLGWTVAGGAVAVHWGVTGDWPLW